MQISCEKCATTYLLDDRLIPDEGAPVQCTKCGHVFHARRQPLPLQQVVFAAPAAPRPVAPQGGWSPQAPMERHGTMAFGMPAVDPAQAAPRGTMAFGMPAVRAAPVPSAPPPASHSTLGYGTGAAPQPQSHPTMAFGTSAVGAPNLFGPQTGALGGGPAPRPASPARRGASLPSLPGIDEEEAGSFEASLRGQRKKWMVMGVAIALLVGAVAVFSVISGSGPRADEATLKALELAETQLKKDDAASLDAAFTGLQSLAAKSPDFVPLLTNQSIVLSFRTADLRDEISRLQAAYNRIDLERAKLERDQATNDWRNRVNTKLEEMAKLKAKTDPLVEKATQADSQNGELLRKLVEQARISGVRDPSLERAHAVYEGYKGKDNAQKVADSYRKKADDGWADLALAAYAAQARLPLTERVKGVAAADAALLKDPSLLRARLLRAKLNLLMNNYSEARTDATLLLAANPAHEAAKQLKDEIDQSEKGSTASAER